MSLSLVNPTRFKPGRTPHNKGVTSSKKINLFKAGKEINCPKHGLHSRWRLCKGSNVQCLYCGRDWQRKRREENPIKYLLVDAKNHAKKKGILFDLTESDILTILSKQNGKCNLSGIEFDSANKFSLDKIDPNGDYTLSNVQLLLIDVNRMKTNLNQDRFLNLCYEITKKSKGRK
jgi:hypothetical protein